MHEIGTLSTDCVRKSELNKQSKHKTVKQENKRKSVEHIAKKGKAAGMHVILVVGRPCVDVLPNSLKTDFLTRICFKTLTGVDSFAAIGLRKACEIESGQLILCREYEYEVLNVLPCARD